MMAGGNIRFISTLLRRVHVCICPGSFASLTNNFIFAVWSSASDTSNSAPLISAFHNRKINRSGFTENGPGSMEKFSVRGSVPSVEFQSRHPHPPYHVLDHLRKLCTDLGGGLLRINLHDEIANLLQRRRSVGSGCYRKFPEFAAALKEESI